jgi:hypothetical protein
MIAQMDTTAAVDAKTPPTWDEIASQLAEIPELQKLANKAREQGQDVRQFADEVLATVRRVTVNEGLVAVFELSRADGWDMEQPAIELVIQHLEDGSSAPEAYDAARLWAGRDLDRLEQAFAAADQARRLARETFNSVDQAWVNDEAADAEHAAADAAYRTAQVAYDEAEAAYIRAAFAAAEAAVSMAAEEDEAASDAENAAYKERQADLEAIPVPDEIMFREGCWMQPRRLTLADLDRPVSRTPAVRAAILAYAAAEAAVNAKHDELSEDVRERSRQTEHALITAEVALLATPSPHLHTAIDKLRSLATYGLDLDLTSAVDVQEVMLAQTTPLDLSPQQHARIAALSLYRDLCRLAGTVSGVEEVKPFDPGAWVDAFEANPGWLVTTTGVSFDRRLAYGADVVEDQDLAITDEVAIQGYYDRLAARGPEYADFAEKERHGNRLFRPAAPSHIEEILVDQPEERARLLALWDKRDEQHREPPALRRVWRDLPKWQRDAVLAYVAQDVRDNMIVGRDAVRAHLAAKHQAEA